MLCVQLKKTIELLFEDYTEVFLSVECGHLGPQTEWIKFYLLPQDSFRVSLELYQKIESIFALVNLKAKIQPSQTKLTPKNNSLNQYLEVFLVLNVEPAQAGSAKTVQKTLWWLGKNTTYAIGIVGWVVIGVIVLLSWSAN